MKVNFFLFVKVIWAARSLPRSLAIRGASFNKV